ncbi:dienelactone hydrolase family protein [Paenibacillus sp. NPDC056579]|uniref:dienelactone hydrolase family protein n=1 Tax=unclassified Paenibacillus TaxID=185978 RepID=UPI001EF8906C|nr:alpha/beta hydrolase family protein [Paenibacillus sp. H1-7]ULL17144.1 dienelactone hydrolase [Paenibacillus sp. H1-7]
MWSPDEYMNRLYDRYDEVRSIAYKQPWQERKTEVRVRLLEAMGGATDAMAGADLKPVVLESVEMKDYIMERVAFTTTEDLRIPSYVLIPKRLEHKAPAVIAWHGHGYGSKEIVGLNPDGTADEGEPGIHKHFAVQLVRRGMVVLAPEIIGFGDRRLAADRGKDPRKSSSCFALASRLLLHGQTLAGLRIAEAMRSLDYLLSREEVDPERIGCMGFSGGGLIASLSAALDERIKAVVLCAFTSTSRGSLLAMNHCIDNYLPSILRYADLPELIGLIAPRALFVESGQEDPLFPVSSVLDALSVLERIYKEEDAAERLGADLFPGKHEISGRQGYDWLARRLRA